METLVVPRDLICSLFFILQIRSVTGGGGVTVCSHTGGCRPLWNPDGTQNPSPIGSCGRAGERVLEEPQTSEWGLCDPPGGTPCLHCLGRTALPVPSLDLPLGLLPQELSPRVVLKLKSRMGF